MTAAPAAWRPPAAFDEYELVKPLGRGRMGLVYLAHDTLLDRHVAIKFIPGGGDAALGRFLREARAAARLQHPNVATLFRVGQLDERPYLVSEFVRGTTLDRLPLPLAYERALPIAIDLARGLAAAHRRGVLHRDLKPANAILAESGEAKLLDFGLAKLLGSTAAAADIDAAAAAPRLSAEDEAALRDLTGDRVIGTPYFMAPEAWRGDESTERSDLFSFGLLLYELCAGRGPFREVPLAELSRVVQETQAPPLRSLALELPVGFAAVIDRCLRLEPDARFAAADQVVARLEALRPSRAAALVPEGNPYRGLRPFEPEHRALFFGRQRAISIALERLRAEPFVLVTGDSGVGKSSLCAAGLLPLIADGGLEDGIRWAVVRLVPGRSPVLALAIALAPHLDLGESEIERLIYEDGAELGRMVRRRLPDGAGLLLYVDQLEELVTLAAEAEGAAASEAIGSLAAGLPGLRLLGTARSDFLSRLEALPGLRDRVARSLFLLAPLSRDEVREAVIGPAEIKQVRFETEALVDALVDSTAAAGGGMPLLQFALAELWERRDRDAGLVPAAALDELGGVAGALSRHADSLIARLGPEQRVVARSVLLRLVTVERTRARRLEDELITLCPGAAPVLEALVGGRLLVASETPAGTTYEIAHEALVGGWDTLAGWLTEEAEIRALVHQIEAATDEWRRHQRARELLWSGRQLAEIAAVPAAALAPREQAFLAASRRARRRLAWLRRGAVAAVIAVPLAVWLGATYQAQRDRDQRVAAALGEASEILAEARSLEDELTGARRAAFAAYDGGQLEAGEAAWSAVLGLRERTFERFRDASDSLERALLLDPGRSAVRRRYAQLLFERALLAEAAHLDGERDQLVRRMNLYDDGGALAARWRAPAILELTSEPPGASVLLRRFTVEDGRRVETEAVSLGRTPLTGVEVAPGPALLELEHDDRAPLREILQVPRGQAFSRSFPLPQPDQVVEGMVVIPAGEGIFGSADDEPVRAFFNALPRHMVHSEAYLIARHETTFAEWLAYLEALSPEERERRTPRLGTTGFQGMLALRRLAAGSWELLFQPGTSALRARSGQPIRYPQRSRNAEQDWQRFPVVGISPDDARAYAAWLDHTGRVPGARLCSEVEWERAARGADDRRFPHGDQLGPQDANFDETYGKDPANFGPDEVGSHPRSRSPFGVDDLAGNVWEWVDSGLSGQLATARGGSFNYAGTTARIVNRETPEPDFRDISVGMRICASL